MGFVQIAVVQRSKASDSELVTNITTMICVAVRHCQSTSDPVASPHKKIARKRKLTGNNSSVKKWNLQVPNIMQNYCLKHCIHLLESWKGHSHWNVMMQHLQKKPCICTNDRSHMSMQSIRIFNAVNEQWQRTACNLIGLQFVSRCDLDGCGPNVPWTRPRRVRHILGDGNCLFHSLSYIITGTESQHLQVREALLNHLASIEDTRAAEAFFWWSGKEYYGK